MPAEFGCDPPAPHRGAWPRAVPPSPRTTQKPSLLPTPHSLASESCSRTAGPCHCPHSPALSSCPFSPFSLSRPFPLPPPAWPSFHHCVSPRPSSRTTVWPGEPEGSPQGPGPLPGPTARLGSLPTAPGPRQLCRSRLRSPNAGAVCHGHYGALTCKLEKLLVREAEMHVCHVTWAVSVRLPDRGCGWEHWSWGQLAPRAVGPSQCAAAQEAGLLGNTSPPSSSLSPEVCPSWARGLLSGRGGAGASGAAACCALGQEGAGPKCPCSWVTTDRWLQSGPWTLAQTQARA